MILLLVGKILGTAVQKSICVDPGLKKLTRFDFCCSKAPNQGNLSLTPNKGLIENKETKFM